MQKPAHITYYFEWSTKYPHIAAVDLHGNSIGVEVAVVSVDVRNGDLYYIRLDQLDSIDLRRLAGIIQKRDAWRYPLWDLLDQTTLNNGMNALEFFQQMVKVRTVGGQIFAPGAGQRGLPINQTTLQQHAYKGPASQGYDVKKTDVEVEEYEEVEEVEVADATPAPVRRKAGRPKKAK